ncbi:MAG: hypothetical protein JW839_12925 [Candidatus Lokiarchaeota archaeon]|nr:hypothetical protein [Candidatus Lokiarchaeota archaeon]
MAFIKIPNALLALVIALKIRGQSKYILNHLFYLAFICWSVNIAFDGVLYIIAPNGDFLFHAANIIRDFGIFMLAFTPLCFMLASFVIKEGEEVTLHVKKKRLAFTFIMSFLTAVSVALTDTVLVVDKTTKLPIDPQSLPPAGAFTVTFDSITPAGQLSSILFLAFVTWYVCSVLLMFSQQARESGRRRARTRLLMFGILMIPVGIIYFILLPYILPTFQALSTTDLRPWVNLIGQLIWATSPVLVYLGIRLGVTAERVGGGELPQDI